MGFRSLKVLQCKLYILSLGKNPEATHKHVVEPRPPRWWGTCSGGRWLSPCPSRCLCLPALRFSHKLCGGFTFPALTQCLLMRTLPPSLQIALKAPPPKPFNTFCFLCYFTGHISIHSLKKVIYFPFMMVFSHPAAWISHCFPYGIISCAGTFK